MSELRISEAAALAIIEQADYFEQAQDRTLALRWEAAVDEAARSLLRWPEPGATCRFRSPALAGLRRIFVPGFRKHIVFYRYLSRENAVLIVHLLHGARNLESILDEDS